MDSPVETLIGVDIGGTKIAAGIVSAQGEVLDYRVCPTPALGGRQVASATADLVRGLDDWERAGVAGAATPGFVSRDGSRVLHAANIRLVDAPLEYWLRDLLGKPVFVLNDANAAVTGEAAFGAARGRSDVALVTVGTGIGGGFLVNGQLLLGATGSAGELGHTILVPGGRKCGCGANGCLDRYASGTAFEGGPLKDAELATLAQHLGRGLSDVVMLLDPEIILLSGGVSGQGERLRAPVAASLKAALAEHNRPAPDVALAELGNTGGLIGAAIHALGMAEKRMRNGAPNVGPLRT